MMVTWKSASSRAKTAFLVCGAVLIVLCLNAAYHAVLESELQRKVALERPWPEGGNAKETDKNMEKYFHARLDYFKNSFPKGADIEALKTAAKDEGYFLEDNCYKAVTKEIPRGGGCVNIGKNYMGQSIMQSYDVLYDENQKIFLIKMGHRLYRD